MLGVVSVLGLVGGMAVLVLAILAAILVFEVWMFISAIQNTAITQEVKLLWLIGMLLIHPFVAIIYYFTDYRKNP
jgi:hypothetical protein